MSNKGKSRAFINDTPVNLQTLKELSNQLVDIHSQHQSLLLSNAFFRLKVIDWHAALHQPLEAYRSEYRNYLILKEQYHSLKEEVGRNQEEYDYLQYQFEQIAESGFKEAKEQDELEKERDELTHAEDIQRALNSVAEGIDGENHSALQQINTGLNELNQIEKFYGPAKALIQRIDSLRLEMLDLRAEAEELASNIEYNPSQLELIEDKLDTLYSLLQKHRFSNLDELLRYQVEIENKLLKTTDSASELEALKLKLEQEEQNLNEKAALLHAKRKKAIPKIEKHVNTMLQSLGMKQASFQVVLEQLDQVNENGKDKVAFLFSSNPKSAPKEVARVASGGEISRLMLCIKSLLAVSGKMPTIIFDEIDTGISGEIAHKVGTIIKQIAADIQVINITHQPQVAAQGDYHYLVYKDEKMSTTGIRLLYEEERVVEIAKMLGGAKLDATALEHAHSLLNSK